MTSITLSRHDPRDPERRPLGRGELNCDRYAVVEGRIFRVKRDSGSWDVEELETETSMVSFDEVVAFSCRNLAEARAKIVRHLEEWPLEDRDAHTARFRANVQRAFRDLAAR